MTGIRLYTIALLMMPLSLVAQSELNSSNDTIGRMSEFRPIEIKPIRSIGGFSDLTNPVHGSYKLSPTVENYKEGQLSQPIKIDLPKVSAIYPSTNYHSGNYFSRAYSRAEFYPLSYNSSAYLKGAGNTYHSMGFYREVSSGIVYRPTDWLMIRGGGYVAAYNLHNRGFNDVGINTNLKIYLHENVRLNFYGQYSVSGASNAENSRFGMPQGIYPQSHYGGTIEVKLTPAIGVEAGFMREYNPRSRRWETHPVGGLIVY